MISFHVEEIIAMVTNNLWEFPLPVPVIHGVINNTAVTLNLRSSWLWQNHAVFFYQKHATNTIIY